LAEIRAESKKQKKRKIKKKYREDSSSAGLVSDDSMQSSSSKLKPSKEIAKLNSIFLPALSTPKPSPDKSKLDFIKAQFERI